MKNTIEKHKSFFSIFACVFLIFIGCFAFPFYNFTPNAPNISRLSNILVSLLAYYEIGVLQSMLFEATSWRKCSAVVLLMTIIGLLCRYLLEFGEVSNTYNFTLPNVLLHLFAAVCVSGFAFSTIYENQ